MKKIIASIMSICMIISITACMGSTEESTTTTKSTTSANANTDGTGTAEQPAVESALPPMTTENITISFALWDDYEMTRYLTDKFMEKYPNITVELKELPLGGYNDSLVNLANTEGLPDGFFFLHDLGLVTSNGWLYDFTDYWDNDPDVDNYFDSLKPTTKLFDGKRAYIMACEYLPILVYLDRAVFNKLNEPMPDYDWTYNQMLGLMKSMTRPDQNIFGYNSYLGLVTMAPIVLNDSQSEFGWDGSNYKFEGAWADAVNMEAEFQRLGYRALQSSEAWAAASGDANIWPGNSGLVAMQLDAWWTMNNIYSKSEAKEKGVDMVPYVVPRGDSAETNRKPAFLDFGAISAGTEHPREAYEFLKWISFSSEAWMHRIDAFQTLTDEAGNKLYDLPNCLPLTNDEAVWTAYRKLYPADEPAYDAFFKLCREPVPLGGDGIPGFAGFLTDVYQNGDFNGVIGIETAVIQGVIDAHDVAADFNKKGREYYDAAMEEFYAIYGR